MTRLSRGGWMGVVLTGALAGGLALAAKAQDAPQIPKPGPEFDVLKKLVGTWDCTIRAGGQESKGTAVYKMECNGLWLVSNFKGSFAGQPFQGRGLDTYDAGKKKYVSVWVDSMATYVTVLEGTYDLAKKALTMASAQSSDEKAPKFKTVSEWKDDDTIEWNMAMVGPDGKGMDAMSITYKRRAGK